MYDIRFCRTDELDRLQDFIYNHWKKDHIFATEKELIQWQHYDRKNDRYNFVVAYNEEDKVFDGILGFIPINHYDENMDNGDIWLAIWKVNETKTKGKLSGIDLFYYLKRQLKPKSIGVIGISDIAKSIYTSLKYEVGNLNQYYILNDDVKEFKIADTGGKNTKSKYNEETSCKITEIVDIEELESIKETYEPNKSINYINNRYLKHPVYKYKLYGIYKEEQLICVIITRKIKVEAAHCIRVVDIYGKIDSLNNISNAIQTMLSDEVAEFIDCINYGIEEEVFYRLGFKKRNQDMIIPNYYEPFERKNVDISFAYKNKYSSYVMFKGDSDQDRPNIIQNA